MRVKVLVVFVVVAVMSAGCASDTKQAVRTTTIPARPSTTALAPSLGTRLQTGRTAAKHRYQYPVGLHNPVTVSFESPVAGSVAYGDGPLFPGINFPEFGDQRGLTLWDLTYLERPVDPTAAGGENQDAAAGGYLEWLDSLDQLTVHRDAAAAFGSVKGGAVRVVGAAHIKTSLEQSPGCFPAGAGIVIAESAGGWECINSGEHAWAAVIDDHVLVTLTWEPSARANSIAEHIIASFKYAR